MKNKKLILFSLLLMVSISSSISAKDEITLQFLGGIPYNLSTELTIRQAGEEEIKINNAQYKTKPFEAPIYYSVRLSKWKDNTGWELELIHQKLYLENKPKEVEHFEISHGYNLVTINRIWREFNLVYHLGIGIIAAHPNTKIRNKQFFNEGGIVNTGYYLTGPTIQFTIGREFNLGDKWFTVLEGKATASHAQIPIKDGKATVPNIALHGLFGLGYRF